MASYFEQDWKPVVFHKKVTVPTSKEAVKHALRTGQAVETVKRTGGAREYSDRARKLEEDLNTDPTDNAPKLAPLPFLSPTSRQTMIKARTDKKMTQAQLAQMVNTRPNVIQDLESGKVIQDKAILQKVNKVLGTSLKYAA
jgi:putative transcription factor